MHIPISIIKEKEDVNLKEGKRSTQELLEEEKGWGEVTEL